MRWMGFVVLVCFLLSACSKGSGGVKDAVPPVITMNAPMDGQVFTAGQSIPISGAISDNNYIAEVHIHVSNLNTGALLMDVHLFPAMNAAIFNQSITAAAGIQYRIQVVAKDLAVNQATTTVEVSCN